MTRKFALAAMTVLLCAGLCLAAGMTTQAPAKDRTMHYGPKPVPNQVNNTRATILSAGFESGDDGFTQVSGNGSTLDDWTRTTETVPYYTTAVPSGSYWWMCNADAYNGVNDEYLYSPVINCGMYSNVQLSFWGAWAFYGSTYYLAVDITTDGSTWTNVFNSAAGVTTSQTFGPIDLSAFNYQSNCQVRFHYYDASWGYGAGIDDVLLTGDVMSLDHNLTMMSIDAPTGQVAPNSPQTPSVTIRNNGNNAENNFWVKYSIDDGTKTEVYYQETQITSALDPATSLVVNFPDFTPVTGNYTTTAWVELAGDEFPGDDTLNGSFTANFLGWNALTTTAPVAVQWPGGCTDGVNLWSVGGLVAGSAVTNVVQVYDPVADSWSQPTTLPVAVFRPNCAIIDGKLYAIGGYNASFAAQAYTQIYDIAANTWSNGTPPPSARGGCGGGVINGKMYIVGGATSGSWPTDCPTWEYDPATDTWTQLADCPRGATGMILGAPFWGAPGLDFIVVGGDYRGYDDYYTFDLTTKGWTTLATGPADAGSKDPGLVWDNEHIYMFGGDPNGSWAGYSDKTYHYNLVTGAWEDLGIALNQAYEGMIGAIIDQKIYSFSGTIGSGPIDPTPFEWTYDLTYGAVVPPEITWVSPADGSTQVHLREPVVLAFSKRMDPGTFDGYLNPTVSMDIAWNATNDTVTLTPSGIGLYDYGTAYSAIVTAGTDSAGVSLEGLPLTATNFTTWLAPDVIQSQMDVPGATYVSQIFGDYPTYSCYIADDVNLAGMDSVKVTAIELMGGTWNGHTFHPFDSLYVSLTTDSADYPAWSQEIWGGNLLPGTFDAPYDGTNFTYIMYLDPPIQLNNGKSWMMFAPYMNFAAKDGQVGWAVNDPAVVYGSAPAWRNPGGGFSYGTDWQRASTNLNMLGDGVWRALGYNYPTGVAGGPTGVTKAVFALMPNFPNPVTGRTTLSFSLPKAQAYSLKVFNIAGQMVKSFDGQGHAGANSVSWDASRSGAGVYFFQLASGGQSATRKLVVLR
jgi:N-acetylneuraminic acid mutarotase